MTSADPLDGEEKPPMQDLRPTRLQLILATVAVVTYAVGWTQADQHTAHAIGWWVLTLLAGTGAIAAGNVGCVVRRVVRLLLAELVPALARIIALEQRQLVVLTAEQRDAEPWESWDRQTGRHLN